MGAPRGGGCDRRDIREAGPPEWGDVYRGRRIHGNRADRAYGQGGGIATSAAGGSMIARNGRVAVLAGLLIALAASAKAGFDVLTAKENDTIAVDTIVLRFRGNIEAPMAADLRSVWSSRGAGYKRLLLDLDSPGGSLVETEKVVDVIATIRDDARIDTLVRHGAMCASACVAIFVQGEERSAGGASVWLFHGACYRHSNVPSLGMTDRYIDILRQAGVSEAFLCSLVDKGYVTTAGNFWLSGYELYHVHKANVITRLLEPWRPLPPDRPSANPQIGPR